MNRCMTTGLMGESRTIQWGTPKELFDKLDDEFHFTLDVCASDGMQMCERYFNPEMDGLSQEWGGRDMLDESPLRRGHHKMGKESCPIARYHRRVIARQNGYEMVSGLGATVCFGDKIHQREGKIQGSFDRCALPLRNRDIQYSEDSEVWGD